MFLFRNRAVSLGIRHSRDIFKSQPPKKDQIPPVQAHSQPVEQQSEQKSSPFPYRFGGLRSYPLDNPKINLLLPKDTPPLFDKYLVLLQAISDKNEKELQKIVEPSLIPVLLSSSYQTRFLNPSESGKVLTHKFDVTIGATFKREQMKFIRNQTPDQEIGLYLPQNFNPGRYMSTGGLPVLLSLETTILSKAKLARDNEGLNFQEAHSIMFEYQSLFSLQDMMGMMAKMPLMKFSSDPQLLKGFLFRGGSAWKVGNIDNFLKARWE